MNAWWTAQEAGLIGGVAGSVAGVLGGVIGTVAGIGAPRGRYKRIVYSLIIAMIAAGIGSLLAGVTALLLGQPYVVYYPLLLIGSVCTFTLGSLFPIIRQRYREADQRRLEAEELRRS